MTLRSALSVRRSLSLAFALLGVLSLATSAHAQWRPPKECTKGWTSDDFGEPPIVEYYANSALINGGVSKVLFDSNGQGFAQVNVKYNPQNLHLLVVTYTPFLIGWGAIKVDGKKDYVAIFPIPPAGYLVNPQAHIFDAFTVTIIGPNKEPMAGASVMWEPFFNGSDPFAMITDSKGQMVINCYQSLPGGNPVYVVSADGKTEFQTNIVVTGSGSGANNSAGSTGSSKADANH
jgi:hypothetical protein